MNNLKTKVTFIKDKFHIRLLEDDILLNEMACKNKVDIGWCCANMLKWHDKLGGSSKMASKSRERWAKRSLSPVGKVWHIK